MDLCIVLAYLKRRHTRPQYLALGGPFMEAYSIPYEVRWTDIDANRHVRYSAYVDAAAEMRFRFFTEHNLTAEAFDRLGTGPVYTSMMINFFREVLLGETLTITLRLFRLSPPAVSWEVWHGFLQSYG